MIGSPNPGYFTYDGDQSTAPDRNQSVPRVPEGSPGIERTLVAYLKSAGKTAEDTSFDGRSDYDGFTMAGIPAGGLFSGAEENKTERRSRSCGAAPPTRRSTRTTTRAPTPLDQIDRDCLGIQGGGVAFAVGFYAQDISGRNGVPVREDRTRHVVTDPESGSPVLPRERVAARQRDLAQIDVLGSTDASHQ